jgi:hypothetical protein
MPVFETTDLKTTSIEQGPKKPKPKGGKKK